jgi:hypothetical protein
VIVAELQPHLVEWYDACDAYPAWTSDRDSGGPVLVRSVGLIVEFTDDHVTLATSESSDGDVSGGVVIPRGCVRRVMELGLA